MNRITETIDSANVRQPRPVLRVSGNDAYSRVRSLRPIDLRLDANEGGGFAADAIGPWVVSAELLRRYPDARPLEANFARKLQIDMDRVVVTAGADDALLRVCNAFLEPGRAAAYCIPTFEMLRRYVDATGADAIEVPWPSSAFPADELIAAAQAASVVFVVSPNNPTGATAVSDDLIRLREKIPTNAVLVLDAAYAEFSDVGVATFAMTLPWTIVTRTLSKAWGAAGLRIGYAAGDDRVIEWLRAVGQPYACSALSLAAAESLLDRGEAASRMFVQRVRGERIELAELLRELGARPMASEANFVLAYFRDAALVADLLAGLGIAVRRFGSHPTLANALRIGCPGDVSTFARLASALRSVLRPEALLFDMDGVIADVSESYREVIRLTAATFGVHISHAEIAEAKNAGDANNDWVLTQRMLAQRGREVALDRVREVFERLYQGESQLPGLCENERLLLPMEVLQSLRARFRLGIVTGRPRSDAVRFLQRTDLHKLFEGMVCMEDAPPKPSPAPVQLALQQLGVKSAWMFGDTPDDIRAARAACVVPVAYRADKQLPQEDETALFKAGTARIVSTPDQLLEILR